jgi:hypothetical protein
MAAVMALLCAAAVPPHTRTARMHKKRGPLVSITMVASAELRLAGCFENVQIVVFYTARELCQP